MDRGIGVHVGYPPVHTSRHLCPTRSADRALRLHPSGPHLGTLYAYGHALVSGGSTSGIPILHLTGIMKPFHSIDAILGLLLIRHARPSVAVVRQVKMSDGAGLGQDHETNDTTRAAVPLDGLL